LDFKITNNLCDRIISLPMHTELDETTLEYISTALIVFFNNTRLT
jgi:dTDP-4-amino-4,6-dideoxygalactose transaminase